MSLVSWSVSITLQLCKTPKASYKYSLYKHFNPLSNQKTERTHIAKQNLRLSRS